MDGAKEFVSTAMKEFCANHGITMHLVPAYSHLLQCRVEGAIRVTKSHARVALKQSGAPLRYWAWATRDFVKKKNHLWARPGPAGKTSTAFDRLRPIGVSNSHAAIAVPFACKIVAQVPRESSLVTNTTHGDRAVEGAYMGADATTDSIHV
jgi:hypothetical protein